MQATTCFRKYRGPAAVLAVTTAMLTDAIAGNGTLLLNRMAVVAAPAYFKGRTVPKKPQDLMEHDCINVRLPTHGGLLPWDFRKGRQEINVRVNGTWVFNGFHQVVAAALHGRGLAFVLEEAVLEHIAAGRLVRVLDNWCHVFPGYHLYYPSRRQPSAAFTLIVAALRYSA